MAEQAQEHYRVGQITYTVDNGVHFATYKVMQSPDRWSFIGSVPEADVNFAALSEDPDEFNVEIVRREDSHRGLLGTCAIHRAGGETWIGLDRLREIAYSRVHEDQATLAI